MADRAGGRRGELAGRRADRIQVGRQAVLRIEHPPQRPAEGPDLDRVEVQRGQVVAKIGLAKVKDEG